MSWEGDGREDGLNSTDWNIKGIICCGINWFRDMNHMTVLCCVIGQYKKEIGVLVFSANVFVAEINWTCAFWGALLGIMWDTLRHLSGDWRRKWQPTLVLSPGKSHGRRSLVGYSPWGRKQSDTTERLHSLHFMKKADNCVDQLREEALLLDDG